MEAKKVKLSSLNISEYLSHSRSGPSSGAISFMNWVQRFAKPIDAMHMLDLGLKLFRVFYLIKYSLNLLAANSQAPASRRSRLYQLKLKKESLRK
jgi:hypothetical protein